MSENPPITGRTTADIDIASRSESQTEGGARAALIIELGDHLQVASLGPGEDDLVIGREIPSDIRIDDKALSRQHARFSWRAGALEVEDLDSRNGTWVAGEMVAWDAPTGGYLIQACLSTGHQAGVAAARWAAEHP